ncbi:MAG: type IV pilus biogenesis/stability protein PilW [Gammaproteobacteria bacterium]
MRIQRLLILGFALLVAGCAGDSGNIRPGTSSNEAAEANLDLGIEYMRRGEYETALEKLNRANKADPRYHAVYNAYGLLYERLGEYEQAEKHYRTGLSLNSKDSMIRNNYGLFLCNRGRYSEAEEQFLQAASNPLYDSPDIAMSNAGTCAREDGDMEKAEEYFRRALKSNPNIPSALKQMSQISFEKENYLSARAYLQRYLENARHTAETLWLGIRIERKLGDKDAESSYGLLLRNNFPDSEEATLYNSSRNRNQ